MEEKLSKKIPLYVYRVADVLVSNGYKAFLVGGSVRDLLLGKIPKDFDIATDAKPDQMENLFPKSVTTGAQFGTIIVIMDDEKGERFDVEVTTFRSESDYLMGRWPSKVEFTNDIVKDLSRRDFTINAIAIDLADIEEKESNEEDYIIDPFNGREDLEKRTIRAVGDPRERFTEDGLRPIRACRFASTLGFEIEKDTFEAIKGSINVTRMVSVERVRDELNKILLDSPKPSKGLQLMDSTGLLELYIPELIENKKAIQPDYHADNAFEHGLKTLDLAEDDIKWAALLHDVGKISTMVEDDKGIHYFGHDVKGSEIATEILTRLRFPTNQIKRIANLIRWHMFYYPSADWREIHGLESKEGDRNQHGWSDGAVRRFIRNVGGEDVVEDLIKLRIADASSNPKSHFDPREIDLLQERISKIKKEDMVLKVTDLQIGGKELNALGYAPGPMYREILEYLLELVLDDPNLNSREQLTQLVKDKYPQ